MHTKDNKDLKLRSHRKRHLLAHGLYGTVPFNGLNNLKNPQCTAKLIKRANASVERGTPNSKWYTTTAIFIVVPKRRSACHKVSNNFAKMGKSWNQFHLIHLQFSSIFILNREFV